MRKVKRLKKGDNIAIISSSAGVPSIFPEIFDAGLNNLKKMGFNIIEYPTARKSIEYLYNNPKKRAEDINNAFFDKNINGIITSIGGNDSIRTLKYINKNAIKNNPKFFMGFSDTSTFNTYFNQLGLITFNGPSIMAGIAQIEKIPNYKKNFEEFLFKKWKNYDYKPYEYYTNGYIDWGTKKVGVKKLIKENNWNFYGGKAKGELFGGCIDVLTMINGTKFWPKPKFFKNKILFLETSEEKPSPSFVKYTLRNFGVQGILNNINGILFGKARDYTNIEKKELDENIKLVLEKEFNVDIPVITNMNFGHTDPQIILPLGAKASINCENKEFKLTESPFL